MTFFSKLKNYDSLTDPPIFMGFVIDDKSAERRPTIWPLDELECELGIMRLLKTLTDRRPTVVEQEWEIRATVVQ